MKTIREKRNRAAKGTKKVPKLKSKANWKGGAPKTKKNEKKKRRGKRGSRGTSVERGRASRDSPDRPRERGEGRSLPFLTDLITADTALNKVFKPNLRIPLSPWRFAIPNPQHQPYCTLLPWTQSSFFLHNKMLF
jgi:hypothetical protein